MGQTIAAAIGALGGCDNTHGIMGAAHASARGGGFSLRNSHGGILKNSKNLSQRGISLTRFFTEPQGGGARRRHGYFSIFFWRFLLASQTLKILFLFSKQPQSDLYDAIVFLSFCYDSHGFFGGLQHAAGQYG